MLLINKYYKYVLHRLFLLYTLNLLYNDMIIGIYVASVISIYNLGF